MAFADIGNCRVVALLRGFVDAIKLVFTLALAMRRNDHGLQTVDFLKLIGFGVGRAGHAANLVVQAEVVLEGDRGQRLVLGLDLHTFFRLNGLVQTIAPAATGHQATGELVHDHDLAVLHHIVLVTVVQVLRTQSGVQVMHQRDVGGVIQARPFGDHAQLRQHGFGFFVTLLGQKNLMRFFVHREVAGRDDALTGTRVGFTHLQSQQGGDLLHRHVGGGVVFGLAADDQRGARLVDQNRIDLIDDGKVERTLHAVMGLIDHVVAQVIKAVFVVGAVGDVGVVSRLFFFPLHVGQVDAHRQTQEVEQLAHPLRITAGQVIVDGDHMHALARQCVQISRQGRCQGLALTGAHLGNLAVV